MESFIQKHRVGIVFLIILAIHVGLYIFLFERANWITPLGYVHTINQIDAYYPDVIRQSKLGAWSIVDSHTTLPTPHVLSYLFFVAAGKIAAVFSVDPVVMYEITRFTGAMAVLVSTYWLITLLLPQPLQIPAIFFTMLFETGPLWSGLLKTPIWLWTAAMPDQTLTAHLFGLPHHLWSEALGTALISVVLMAVKRPGRFLPVIIIVLGLASVSTDPTYPVIVASCVLGPWVVYAAFTKNLKRTIPPIMLAVGSILVGGLFIKMQFAKGPPWNTFVSVEKSWWTTGSILIPLIQSFELYYPFVIVLLGLIPFVWRTWTRNIRFAVILCLCWSVLPVGLIYLSGFSWFPIANGRLASDLSPVPIGILSALAVYTVYTSRVIQKYARVLLLVLFTAVACLSVNLSIIYFRQFVEQQDNEVWYEGYSYTYYQPKNLWNGIMALKGVPKYSHIMVLPRIGEIMPALLPVRTYQGSEHSFTDWSERRYLSNMFYSGEMAPSIIAQLFIENTISYVFQGPEEKEAEKTKTFYPDIFTIMYQNPDVTIYKVRANSFRTSFH